MVTTFTRKSQTCDYIFSLRSIRINTVYILCMMAAVINSYYDNAKKNVIYIMLEYIIIDNMIIIDTVNQK